MFSLNGTLKKVGRSGDGKRNNLLGWPHGQNTSERPSLPTAPHPPSKNNLVLLIILGIKKENFKKTQFTAHFVHNFIHLVTVSDDNV